MQKDRTIVAIGTAPGKGGIAVVRLSGKEAKAIALKHLSVEELKPRKATYCHFDELDDVVALYFAAPHSYTGEDTVEISCHGSLYVQKEIVERLIRSGAKLAEAGEFTMRAFASGRLNLSQAEAVMDLIDASTPAQHKLAVSQLRGGYAEELKRLREKLIELTSLLELELDFSEEDVEFANRERLTNIVDTLIMRAEDLIGSFSMGNAMKRGVGVAIIGKPNVGKSTLLNALLQDERAIVSPIPGTTRDTVEEEMTIGGVLFRLIDTAGIREATDEVEKMGIERSRKAQKEAEIVIEVIDATTDIAHLKTSDTDKGKKKICVINKCDVNHDAYQYNNQKIGKTLYICASAKEKQGVDNIKRSIYESVSEYEQREAVLSNIRHRDALLQMEEALRHVGQGLTDGVPTDLVAVDLRDALYHLGTITGDVATEELLCSIFSRFCIGK